MSSLCHKSLVFLFPPSNFSIAYGTSYSSLFTPTLSFIVHLFSFVFIITGVAKGGGVGEAHGGHPPPPIDQRVKKKVPYM